MTPIVAIANQKGGVGKTTTTNNLGKYLAKKGFKTLLIDFDSQGNLSYTFTNEKHNKEALILDICDGYDTKPLYIKKNLDLYCANKELRVINDRGDDGYFQLAEGIENIINNYDIVLIDCLPSLSAQLISPLVAATHVLIPSKANELSSQGLEDLIFWIKKVKRRMNSKLNILGILLTTFEKNTRDCKNVEFQIREIYQNNVFFTSTSKSIDYEESIKPKNILKDITDIKKNSAAAIDFKHFAEEFIDRLSLDTNKSKNKEKKQLANAI